MNILLCLLDLPMPPSFRMWSMLCYVLEDMLNKFIIVYSWWYLDLLQIWDQTYETHKGSSATPAPESLVRERWKVQVPFRHISFLVFALYTGQISMDSAKVEAVMNCAFSVTSFAICPLLSIIATSGTLLALVWGSQATLFGIDWS